MKSKLVPAFGVAGKHCSFSLTITVEGEPIRTGGQVIVSPLMKQASIFRDAQVEHPAAENYASVRLPEGVEGTLEKQALGEFHAKAFVLTITKGSLSPGDTVKVIFGDTTFGGPGLRLRPLASTVILRISMRSHAEAEQREFPGAEAVFTNLPAQPAELQVRARKQPGRESILLRAGLVDRFGNTAMNVPAGLTIESAGAESRAVEVQFPESGKALTEAEIGLLEPAKGLGADAMASFLPDTASVARIQVRCPMLELQSRSDPVCVTKPIFWGDLHCHTKLAQGLETLEFLYDYARNDAALDFLCHVEHYLPTDADRWINDEWKRWYTRPASLVAYIQDAWDHQKELVRRYYEPGRFVPFLGFEHATNIYGHMNVIYPGLEGEVLYPQGAWSVADPPSLLFERLADTEALVIPHHPSWPVRCRRYVSGVDWSFYDERLTRLVEICSKHGVSEYFGCPDAIPNQAPDGTVRKALSKGYHLGFVGSTDSHASRPGSCWLPGDLWAARAGITAVFAERLDRQSIYDALKNRRCYATTGARIFLEFSVNEAPMGSEINCAPDQERVVRLGTVGTAGIVSMELIRNGEVIYRQKHAKPQERMGFEFHDRHMLETDAYYYLRIMQEDGHQAWASPIWVSRREG